MAARRGTLQRRASVANAGVFEVSMQLRPHSTFALRRRSLASAHGDSPDPRSKTSDITISVVTRRRRQSTGDTGGVDMRRFRSQDTSSEDTRTSPSPKRSIGRRSMMVEGLPGGTRGKEEGSGVLVRRRSSVASSGTGSPKSPKGWNRIRHSIDDDGAQIKASPGQRMNTRRMSSQKDWCKDEYKDCCMYGDASALKQLKDKDAELCKTTAVGWGLAEIASSYGNIDALELLLEKKVDLDRVTSDGHTALTAAARSGQSESVKYILRHISLQRSGKHNPSIPPLSWAAMYGHLDIVKRILAAKADVNEVDVIERSPVMWAAMHGHLSVVKHLVEARAQIDCAYCEALCYQHNEAVEFLILANECNCRLLKAARSANLRDVRKAILVDEANVDAQDEEGWTALMWGVISDSFDIIVFLTSSGADVAIQNDDGFTAKELAQKHSNNWSEVAQYLETLSLANANIIKGARWGDAGLIRSGISAKGSVNLTDDLNWAPIHWASNRGDASVIRMLVEAKASIESKDGDGHSPFLICSLFGHLDCIKRMADKVIGLHPNIRARTKENEGAIELAAKAGRTDTLIWLLEYNRSNRKGKKEHLSWEDVWGLKDELFNEVTNALFSASSLGHVEVVKALGERKFDLSAKSEWWGWEDAAFPLLLASRHGHRAIVQYLLSNAGSAINDADSEGRTPLYWAVRNSRDLIVDMLIDYEADLNCVADGGFTLLHAAALAGNQDTCQTLIANNLDVNVKTEKDKLTPADCAKEEGHVEIQHFLESFMMGGTAEKWRPMLIRSLSADAGRLGADNAGIPARPNTCPAGDSATVLQKTKKQEGKSLSLEKNPLRVEPQSGNSWSKEKPGSRDSQKDEKSLSKEKPGSRDSLKKDEKSTSKEKTMSRGLSPTKALSKANEAAHKTIIRMMSGKKTLSGVLT
eukprot:GEMP01000551.1.p2 GENE.GEMP01000551.1~~GEMP01000551.1.p2  ORF type:complete len:924 (+),score=205.06 GEMP01000551.1:3422-6193(+)